MVKVYPDAQVTLCNFPTLDMCAKWLFSYLFACLKTIRQHPSCKINRTALHTWHIKNGFACMWNWIRGPHLPALYSFMVRICFSFIVYIVSIWHLYVGWNSDFHMPKNPFVCPAEQSNSSKKELRFWAFNTVFYFIKSLFVSRLLFFSLLSNYFHTMATFNVAQRNLFHV